MKPELSYTIWFTQRTGSSLLCKALQSTGVAGNPGESLNMNRIDELEKLENPQDIIWERGMNGSRVYGVKLGHHQPYFDRLVNVLRKFPGGDYCKTEMDVYNNAFPNGKHIFMSRRNKVRLAVSWWKWIQTGEVHRVKGDLPKNVDVSDKYLYNAVDTLVACCVMREAAIQELFSQAGIIPMNIYYEDFIADYEGTVFSILNFLGIQYDDTVKVAEPYFDKLADAVSDEWVHRYRKERQEGWQFIGW